MKLILTGIPGNENSRHSLVRIYILYGHWYTEHGNLDGNSWSGKSFVTWQLSHRFNLTSIVHLIPQVSSYPQDCFYRSSFSLHNLARSFDMVSLSGETVVEECEAAEKVGGRWGVVRISQRGWLCRQHSMSRTPSPANE